MEKSSESPASDSHYLPQFDAQEQTPTQRWQAVRSAIGAGASDRAVPSQDMAHLELRYIVGELDQPQVHDELLRWYRPDIAPRLTYARYRLSSPAACIPTRR